MFADFLATHLSRSLSHEAQGPLEFAEEFVSVTSIGVVNLIPVPSSSIDPSLADQMAAFVVPDAVVVG